MVIKVILGALWRVDSGGQSLEEIDLNVRTLFKKESTGSGQCLSLHRSFTLSLAGR